MVAVDTRTAAVTWTPVKGADHYVLEWAPAMRLYTSATTATVTDLYPGDEAGFAVRAETKKNQRLAAERLGLRSLAPEGPARLNGYAAVRRHGEALVGQRLRVLHLRARHRPARRHLLQLAQHPELRRPGVAGLPGPVHHGLVRGALCQPLGHLVDLVGADRGDDPGRSDAEVVAPAPPHSAREVGAEPHDVADDDDGGVLDAGLGGARSAMSPSVPKVTRWSGAKPRSTIATGQDAGRPASSSEPAERASRPTPMSSTTVWSVPGGTRGQLVVAGDDGEAAGHAAVGDRDAGRGGHRDGARHAGHDLDPDAVRLARAAAPRRRARARRGRRP